MLPVVFYGFETWSVTMKEVSGLRVFENRVLGRLFGSKRDEVTGELIKIHNEEPHDLCCSTNIFRVINSRRMRLAGHVAGIGDERGVYRVLVGKPERKRPFGRPRHERDDNIKIDLQEVWCMDMD
jgi:hypothetical protein